MKILFCIDSLGIGGKERQSVELVKALMRHEMIDLTIVSMDAASFYAKDILNLPISLTVVNRNFRWDPFVFIQFYRILVSLRPNIVHTNGMLTSFYLLPLCHLLGITMINGSIRNAFTKGGLKWHLERFLLKCSSVRVANSNAGLESRSFSTLPRKNVVINNGFDFSRLSNLEDAEVTKARFGIPQDKKIVGMVAEFSNVKDYETYFVAARLVLKAYDDVVFLAIGGGPLYSRFARTVSDLAGRIRLLGPQRQIESLINTFNVAVLSTYTEGFSNSIMEYMALEKPVIATSGSGNMELVLDDETGFLVHQKDPDTLARRIMQLLEDPDIAKEMGKRGKKRIEKCFSIENMGKEYKTLYEAVLRSPSSDIRRS